MCAPRIIHRRFVHLERTEWERPPRQVNPCSPCRWVRVLRDKMQMCESEDWDNDEQEGIVIA